MFIAMLMFACVCVQQLWCAGPTGALATVLIMVWDLKSPAEAGSAQGEQNTAPEPEQMKLINHVRMHHIHSVTEHQPAHTHMRTRAHTPPLCENRSGLYVHVCLKFGRNSKSCYMINTHGNVVVKQIYDHKKHGINCIAMNSNTTSQTQAKVHTSDQTLHHS